MSSKNSEEQAVGPRGTNDTGDVASQTSVVATGKNQNGHGTKGTNAPRKIETSTATSSGGIGAPKPASTSQQSTPGELTAGSAELYAEKGSGRPNLKRKRDSTPLESKPGLPESQPALQIFDTEMMGAKKRVSTPSKLYPRAKIRGLRSEGEEERLIENARIFNKNYSFTLQRTFDTKSTSASTVTANTPPQEPPQSPLPKVEEVEDHFKELEQETDYGNKQFPQLCKQRATGEINHNQKRQAAKLRRLTLCGEMLYQAVMYDGEIEKTLTVITQQFETMGIIGLINKEESQKLTTCLLEILNTSESRKTILNPFLQNCEKMIMLLQSFGVELKHKAGEDCYGMHEIDLRVQLGKQITDWFFDDKRMERALEHSYDQAQNRILDTLLHPGATLSGIVLEAVKTQRYCQDMISKQPKFKSKEEFRKWADLLDEDHATFEGELEQTFQVLEDDLRENFEVIKPLSLEPEETFTQERDMAMGLFRLYIETQFKSTLNEYSILDLKELESLASKSGPEIG